MTFNQLTTLCDELNTISGRTFRVRGQNGVVCLHDEVNSCYSPWLTNATLGRWMDALRRGIHIGKKAQAKLLLTPLKKCLEYVPNEGDEDMDGREMAEDAIRTAE